MPGNYSKPRQLWQIECHRMLVLLVAILFIVGTVIIKQMKTLNLTYLSFPTIKPVECDRTQRELNGTLLLQDCPQHLQSFLIQKTPNVQNPQDLELKGPLEGPSTSHSWPDADPEPQVPSAPKTSTSSTSASHRRWDAKHQQTEHRRNTGLALL